MCVDLWDNGNGSMFVIPKETAMTEIAAAA
jgi:hypothetical protein